MDANPMNDAARAGGGQIPGRSQSSTDCPMAAPSPNESSVVDSVEFSQAGLALSKFDIGSLQIAQVREIHAELRDISDKIKAGEFLTPERIGVTVDRLLDLFGEGAE